MFTDSIVTNHLEEFQHTLPTIIELINPNWYYVLSDMTHFIWEYRGKDIQINNTNHNRDRKIEKTDPAYEVIHARKKVTRDISAEILGKTLRFSGVPIFNNHHQVIGSLAILHAIDDQIKMMEASETVANSTTNIAAATQRVQLSSKQFQQQMAELSKAQQEMLSYTEYTTKVLGMINGVAKSTRILGLNAGIEAARSGEAGKGFAVVASEITKLANQSAHSVTEIHEVMGNLRQQVLVISNTLQDTLAVSEQQGNAITEIAEALDKLTGVSEQVSQLAKLF